MKKSRALTLVMLFCLLSSSLVGALFQVSGDTIFAYSADITPNRAYVGQTTIYTITLNDLGNGTGSDGLGSADIIFPTGYSVNAEQIPIVTASSGKIWIPSISSTGIHLRAQGNPNTLEFGESVSVTFVATNPLAPGLYTWYTNATTNSGLGGQAFQFALIGDFPISSADAAYFIVSEFPNIVAAGELHTLNVTAVDAYGNRATGYNGTIRFTTSSPLANLPDDYTFNAATDQGVHIFSASLNTVGTQNLTATDIAAPSINGTQNGITVTASSLDHFEFEAISDQVTGFAFPIAITAKDVYGNTVQTYAGVNTLSYSAGTLSPSSTTAFASGTWTGSVVVIAPGNNVYITTTGATKSGASNNFTVTATGFTVTPIAGTGGTITPSTVQLVNLGDNSSIFNIQPQPGYSIQDVKVDGTSQGAITSYQFINIQASHIIEATFTQNTYSVTATVQPSAAGTVTPNATGPYHYGDLVILTEAPNPGYTFGNWSGDGSGTGITREVTVTGNMSVTASFTQLSYEFTVYTIGVGFVAPANGTYHLGDTFTLTATSTPNWHFIGWTGTFASPTESVAVLINGTTTVTATFSQNMYSLTMYTVGQGSVVPGNQTYSSGTLVNLQAINVPGWTFTGWSGDASGTSTSATITMNGPKTVTATFQANPVPTPTPTPTQTPTPTPTQTPAPTQTPPTSTSPSPSPTPTTSPTSSPTPTTTIPPTFTPSPSPTAIPTNSPSATPTPVPTTSPTPSPLTPTSTPSTSATPTNPSATPNSPTPTPSSSPTASATASPTQPQPSPSPSQTASPLPSSTPSATSTPEGASLYTVAEAAGILFAILLIALLIMALYRRKTITATSGPNGKIIPSGKVKVQRGSNKTFNIAASLAHRISNITVDGKEIGPKSSYTFKDIKQNHKIHVTFKTE